MNTTKFNKFRLSKSEWNEMYTFASKLSNLRFLIEAVTNCILSQSPYKNAAQAILLITHCS